MAFFLKLAILLFLTNQVFALTPIQEIQEVRLAKIELAITDKDFDKAFELIKMNMDKDNFHIPTYYFLAKLHLEKGNNSKAMRVYYYIIKKVHPIDGKKIILQKNIDSLNKLLKSISVPSTQALEVYMEIGKTYLAIAESFENNKDFQKQLYMHAYKFFRVCERFRYDLASSKYFLGLTSSKLDNYQEAIQNFNAAKEEFTKGNPGADLQNINYLLADSLIRDGHTEAGMIFLKSISLDPSAETSLKQFANLYIRGITIPYFTFKFGYDYGYNSNVNSLTDIQLETLDPSVYGKKSANFNKANLDVLFSSKHYGNFSFVSSFRFSDLTYNDPLLIALDERVMGGAFSLRYDNFEKSLLRFGLDYRQTYTPIDQMSGHKKNNTFTELSAEYIYNLKSGTLSYQIPIEVLQYEFEQTARITKSLIISYTPFWNTIYFSPSYSAKVSQIEEGEFYSSNSMAYSLTASNYTTFNRRFTLFAYSSFIMNTNANADLSYSEFLLSAYLSYRFQYIKGLSIDFDATQSIKSWKSSAKTNVFDTSFGLTYTY
ncbi:lipopolysaccharide assembly protein LapB [Halobacteriovorax sp. HLS]|uniref:tetratricopeptide repeat protein n=1 Tax=Halobacteriovorax sp. HLS TaxID=2234000 RepID=UPI000FDB3F02|nr:hypothetical protein [Halobacteriovorax sp. HLS]